MAVVSTLPATNDLGSNTILLLKSLYLTVTVVPIPGWTSRVTLSLNFNPCVEAVATVTVFLWPSALTTLFLTVLKLWYTPVPIPVNLNNPLLTVVLAIPTNVPVLPIPTWNVWIPTKSLDIFPIYKGASVGRVYNVIPSVETPIALPVLVL